MKSLLGLFFIYCAVPGWALQSAEDADMAKVCYQKGDSLLQSARYDSALHYFELAASFSGKDYRQWLSCRAKVATSHYRLGNYSEAQVVVDQLLNHVLPTGEPDSAILADAYHTYGSLLNAGDSYDSAILMFKKAYDIKIHVYGRFDARVAGTLNNLGLVYKRLGKYDEALEFLAQALNITELSKDSVNQAKFLNNMGNIYSRKGDFHSSLNYYSRSLDILKITLQKTHPSKAFTLANMGNTFRSLGQNDLDLRYKLMALEIIRKSLGVGTTLREAELLGGVGLAYLDLGNLDSALYYEEYALEILAQLEELNGLEHANVLENIGWIKGKLLGPDSAIVYHRLALAMRLSSHGSNFIGESHKEIGAAFLELNQYDSARYHLERSLDILKQSFGNKNRHISYIYFLLAELNAESGNVITALQLYQKALRETVFDFDDNSLYASPKLSNYSDPRLLLRILRGKGRVLYNLGKSTDDNTLRDYGLRSYGLGLDLIELIRQSHLSLQDKLNFGQEASITYDESIELAFDAYQSSGDRLNLEMARSTADRSKSGTLKETLSIRNRQNKFGLPDSLFDQEHQLKTIISGYRTEILKEKSQPRPNYNKLTGLAELLFDARHRSEELMVRLREEYPQYYRYSYVAKNPDSKELKEGLKPSEALIEYYLSDTSLFTFVLTHEDFLGLRYMTDSIPIRIGQLLHSISGPNFHSDESYKNFLTSSRLLFKDLVEPVLSLLTPSVTNLIIVPHKEIAYLPFETLLINDPSPLNNDPNNLPYLVRKYSISYSFSSSLRANFSGPGKEAKERFLGLAPTYPSTDPDRPLPTLSFNQTELIEIGQIQEGVLRLGTEATETNFKKEAPNYQILHLAMHAQANNEEPLYSKLAFSPSEDSIEDGWLHSFEIFDLQLPADLVTLSACNTGTGKLQSGEGIMSLARGFSYAGSRCILMSHWSVNDGATATIMSSFYKHLDQGWRKDDALHHAKLDYLNSAGSSMAHPYFWAGFVLMGDTKPLNQNDHDYPIVTAFSLALLGLVLLVLKREKLVLTIKTIRARLSKPGTAHSPS